MGLALYYPPMRKRARDGKIGEHGKRVDTGPGWPGSHAAAWWPGPIRRCSVLPKKAVVTQGFGVARAWKHLEPRAALWGCSSAFRWLRLRPHPSASSLRTPARHGWAARGSLCWQNPDKLSVQFLPSDFDCWLVIDFIISSIKCCCGTVFSLILARVLIKPGWLQHHSEQQRAIREQSKRASKKNQAGLSFSGAAETRTEKTHLREKFLRQNHGGKLILKNTQPQT